MFPPFMKLNDFSHYSHNPFTRNLMPEPALLRQKGLREYMDIYIIQQKAVFVNLFVNLLSTLVYIFIYYIKKAF
jgi:hypothetical protein